MILCIAVVIVATLVLSEVRKDELRITYYAEAVALVAFGVAWIVAGKVLKPIRDGDEALQLFGAAKK